MCLWERDEQTYASTTKSRKRCRVCKGYSYSYRSSTVVKFCIFAYKLNSPYLSTTPIFFELMEPGQRKVRNPHIHYATIQVCAPFLPFLQILPLPPSCSPMLSQACYTCEEVVSCPAILNFSPFFFHRVCVFIWERTLNAQFCCILQASTITYPFSLGLSWSSDHRQLKITVLLLIMMRGDCPDLYPV